MDSTIAATLLQIQEQEEKKDIAMTNSKGPQPQQAHKSFKKTDDDYKTWYGMRKEWRTMKTQDCPFKKHIC